jgi:3-keto-disaccharide hydrolase
MRAIFFATICAFVVTMSPIHAQAPAAAGAGEVVTPDHVFGLFNGKDLSNWEPDVPAKDKDPSVPPSFVVRNGMLVSMGKPEGHLVTKEQYKDYRLVAEYRFPGKPGNCGILVHASTPRALYKMFPKSIEVQMMSGDAGDFWCIQENIEVKDMETRRPRKAGEKWGGAEGDARRILNLTDNSEKPLGEWNTMIIEARGKALKVWVNGDLVNEGFNASVDHGKIAIQAEGAEVEFRKVEIGPLK